MSVSSTLRNEVAVTTSKLLFQLDKIGRGLGISIEEIEESREASLIVQLISEKINNCLNNEISIENLLNPPRILQNQYDHYNEKQKDLISTIGDAFDQVTNKCVNSNSFM